MKFEVLNRFTGNVQFIAKIKCNQSDSHELKLGLAVKWALNNNANLSDANLRNSNIWGADLSDANLCGADLSDANLSDANLRNANLSDANLCGANLWGADLRGADLSDAKLMNANLRGANLCGANPWGADLRGADLRGADLSDAKLRNANLSYANLRNANLWGADLRGANGLNNYVKCIQLDTYCITYTSEVLQIGCEKHLLNEWTEFDDERILRMDGKKALKWWKANKGWLFETIDKFPAKPTKSAEELENAA